MIWRGQSDSADFRYSDRGQQQVQTKGDPIFGALFNTAPRIA